MVDLLRQMIACVAHGVAGSSFVMLHLWNKCRRMGSYLVNDVSCAALWQRTNIPSCEELRQLIDSISVVIQQQQLAARAARERIWKEKFTASWNASGAQVYQWCKGEGNERADMISRPDGSLTCDPDEMDGLVRHAWLPIFIIRRTSSPIFTIRRTCSWYESWFQICIYLWAE
jgi:hypothetical protein